MCVQEKAGGFRAAKMAPTNTHTHTLAQRAKSTTLQTRKSSSLGSPYTTRKRRTICKSQDNRESIVIDNKKSFPTRDTHCVCVGLIFLHRKLPWKRKFLMMFSFRVGSNHHTHAHTYTHTPHTHTHRDTTT